MLSKALIRCWLSTLCLTLSASVLAEDNDTNSTEGSGTEPTPIIKTHSSYHPLPDYNRITPQNNDDLKVEISTDNMGNYVSIDVYVPDSVINTALPGQNNASDTLVCNENGACIGGHHAFFSIPQSDGLESFPYQTVQVNWNPYGHPPIQFVRNHFDFHFHTQTLDELKKIEAGTCTDELFSCKPTLQEKAKRQLTADYLPLGYSSADLIAAVPWMGTHLIHGATFPKRAEDFTQVLIHGAWDGQLSFQEPMITVEYLNSLKTAEGSRECFAIPQPARYSDSKVYPQRWCASYAPDNQMFKVSLTQFPEHVSSTPSSGWVAKARMIAIIILLYVAQSIPNLFM